MPTISINNWFTKFFLISIFLYTPVVFADGSVSIQSLSPGQTDRVGNEVTFNIVSSGFNSAISYAISDSLSGSSISSSNINSNGIFAWIPTSADVGTHNLTINLTDQSGDSATLTEQLIVPLLPVVSINSVSPGSSVNVGQTVFFNASAVGFINPQYSVADSVMTSSLTPSAINSSGGFSWTPKNQDAGSHSITVTANDYLGDSASATIGVNVGVVSSSIQSLSPSATVFLSQNVTFTVVTTGFTNPTYTISDSLYGSSINSLNIDYNGNFSWTPKSQDVGSHNITVMVRDSLGNVSTVSQPIIVSGTGISISSMSPGLSITPGTIFAFIASTTGFVNQSVYSVSDSFVGTSLTTKNITADGVFSWTPILSDIGTHTISVFTLDNFGQSLRSSITVNVAQATTTTTTLGTNSVGNNTTTGALKYHFSHPLSVGSRGADVTALQNFLISQKFFSGPISGYFGSLTFAAVKKFQKAHNLSQVGTVGPLTRALLNQ